MELKGEAMDKEKEEIEEVNEWTEEKLNSKFYMGCRHCDKPAFLIDICCDCVQKRIKENG
jgi:hypothetical protein